MYVTLLDSFGLEVAIVLGSRFFLFAYVATVFSHGNLARRRRKRSGISKFHGIPHCTDLVNEKFLYW